MAGRIDAKRVTDMVLGAVAVPAALPFIALAALLSAFTYRAWPLFVQQGRAPRWSFHCSRSAHCPPRRPVHRQVLRRSRRDLGAMRFLRKTHLDELPQLFLVVTGQFSLVGPRPEIPPLHKLFPSSVAAERTSVRPGLTGLWQISPHCQGLIAERPEYDRIYVEHRHMLLDVWILAGQLSR